MNILAIGDSHAKPGVSNRRYSWLGELIVDLKPDVVVDIGDWGDMPSLSSYDGSSLTGSKPKTAAFEGRRYKDDIEASVEARDRVYQKLKAAKKKMPRLVALGGNHDDERITRALNLVPELRGVISVDDHQRKEYRWEHVPFLQPIEIGGFNWSHYFTSGVMGKPVGGEYPATALLKKQFTSCIAGHSHLFDESHRATAKGTKIQAFIAGCFLDPKQREEYAGAANEMWDSGLLYMKDVENGFCTGGFNWITVKRIQENYGK